MQPREATQIRVGLFVFAGVFTAMIVIFLLGGEKQLFTREYRLRAFFEDISGLRVGAPILLAGVRVGLVDRIDFGKNLNEKKVEVRLAIEREFQERIRRDSTATVTTQGLLGDKIVTIGLGSPDQDVLAEGEMISTEERPSFFTIAEKSGVLMENINKAARAVTHVLEDPLAQDLSATAKELRVASRELRQILEKVNRGEGTIGALLADPGIYYDIRRLFGRIERNKLLRHVIRSRIRDLEQEKGEPR